MKRIYRWITKANQVLFFFVMIGGTALVLLLIYQSSRRYEPPHVSVAQTPDEAKEKSVVQDVVLLGQWSEIYVLGIMKRVVTAGKDPWLKPSVSYLGKGDENSGQIVNVVFSRGEQRIRTLLEKDGLVLSHNMYNEQNRKVIKALLFSCVTEDTDGNHRLDEKDRNDLYVVADGLASPDIVVKGVSEFRVIGPTHVAIKTGEGSAARFWDLDTEARSQKEILWK